MKKTRQVLIGELRNTVIICALSLKHEEKGKITRAEAYGVLKRGIAKADRILKELAEKANL